MDSSMWLRDWEVVHIDESTRNEARITNLEKEYMALGARIEEDAADTAEEFKVIRQEIQTGISEEK